MGYWWKITLSLKAPTLKTAKFEESKEIVASFQNDDISEIELWWEADNLKDKINELKII